METETETDSNSNMNSSLPIVWQAGDLSLSNGLLVILDQALSKLMPNQTFCLVSTEPSTLAELKSWCKIAGHSLSFNDTASGAITYSITKGSAKHLLLDELPDWGLRAQLDANGEFATSSCSIGRAANVPEHASRGCGFAPRGAVRELHSPEFSFAINDKDQVWATEIAELYDQAVANQWDASSDIRWQDLPELPEPIELAVCQLMTFLIENEYSALYVPGKFLSRINPQYFEVVLFLSTQLMDEARHIEVFTKRALANGGGLQICTASTEHSLKSLLDQEDFSCASFLLSVLGEGTFIDLLRFIEDVAPDQVTREIVRRARVDETRHVHFGMAHIKYLLSRQPEAAEKLIGAVEGRARQLTNVTSVNEHVAHALIVLAAGGLEPEQLKLGSSRVSELFKQMDENRKKRLTAIGFSEQQAIEISFLHTPNFM